MLTEGQRQQYEDDGYLVARGLIDLDDLRNLRRRMEQLAEDGEDWPVSSFLTLDPERFRNTRGGPMVAAIFMGAKREQVFAAVASHPNLAGAMRDLLADEVFQSTDQALFRNKDGGQTFYHQDSYYWNLPPKVGCNAWIPLDEVGRGAGALAIMPGSQRDWSLTEHELYYDEPSYHRGQSGESIQRKRIPLDEVDFSKEILLPMQPGDVAFFSNFTWHRAEPNLTDHTQCAYAVAYERLIDKARQDTIEAYQ